MKYCFKYKGGYVNIDDENICLTITVSRQGARELKERRSVLSSKILTWTVYVAFTTLCVWLHSYIMLVLVTALIGVNNLYPKKDALKIPLCRLNKIERKGRMAVLYYNTEAGNAAKQNLRKVDEKDYKVLLNLTEK